ncbi:MAG: type IV toxin-antitoxin system AbiEi family antitoxin domain-containing protein [Chloroflexi bacterium]|nr:type IV toxin-antitoxin system AbiEi family antitoxin domain-containing protein [Chloroflexota bacterium]
MQKSQYLETILRSSKTVFTLEDIALLWQEPGTQAVRVRLSYYVRRGKLYRIRKGLYAKDKNYSKLEVATRIFTPSYVSFETILAREGLIFQFHTQISVASYLTRDIEVDGQIYSFRKIKMPILTHPMGVENKNETSFATRERAWLDTLYLRGEYQIDNPNGLDWNRIFDMLPIYHNQRMASRVRKLYKQLNRSKEGSP